MPSDDAEKVRKLLHDYEYARELAKILVDSRSKAIEGVDEIIEDHERELEKWVAAERRGEKKPASAMIRHHRSRLRKYKKERNAAVKKRNEALKQIDELNRRISGLTP